MTAVSRRILPFAAILAVAVTLAVWITAGAAPPASPAGVLAPMHFRTVTTSGHFSPNGATQKNPVGASYQATVKLVSDGRQIGTAFLVVTIVNKAGWGLENIEGRFPGRGRVELQGMAPPNGGGTQAITGGTGIFTHARGWATSRGKNGNNVTVTFR